MCCCLFFQSYGNIHCVGVMLGISQPLYSQKLRPKFRTFSWMGRVCFTLLLLKSLLMLVTAGRGLNIWSLLNLHHRVTSHLDSGPQGLANNLALHSPVTHGITSPDPVSSLISKSPESWQLDARQHNPSRLFDLMTPLNFLFLHHHTTPSTRLRQHGNL